MAYATTVFIIGLLLLQGSWSALRVPAFMLLERARILIFKPSVCHPEVLSPNLFFSFRGAHQLLCRRGVASCALWTNGANPGKPLSCSLFRCVGSSWNCA